MYSMILWAVSKKKQVTTASHLAEKENEYQIIFVKCTSVVKFSFSKKN